MSDTTTVEWPERLRMWGADTVCASRPQPQGLSVTACGYLAVGPDEERPAGEPVSCARCLKTLSPAA